MQSKSTLQSVLTAIDSLRQKQIVLSDRALHEAAVNTLAIRRISTCSKFATQHGVALVKGTGRNVFSGYIRCKAHQICPICHTAWLREYARKLNRIIKHWPGKVTTISLTISHKWSTPLGETLRNIQSVRAAFVASKEYRAPSIQGALLRVETSIGEGGWHPHLHGILLSPRELTPSQIAGLEGAWIKAARGIGLIAAKTHAAKGRCVFDKTAAFNEAAYMWKRGERSPFALLEIIAAPGSSRSEVEDAKILWRDYCLGVTSAFRMRYVTPARVIKDGLGAYSSTEKTREQALDRIKTYVAKWEQNGLPIDLAGQYMNLLAVDVESLRHSPEIAHRIHELEELTADLIEERDELGLPEDCDITFEINAHLDELIKLLAAQRKAKPRLPVLVNLSPLGARKLLPSERIALEKATTHSEVRGVLERAMARIRWAGAPQELFSLNYEDHQIDSMTLPSMDLGDISSK